MLCSPEYPLRPLVLGRLFLIVEVRLSDGDEGVLPGRRVPLSHPVLTADVPGIDTGIVGGLYAAGSAAATLQQAVAVGAGVQFAPVGALGGVAVAYPRVAQPEELVRELELEGVAGALTERGKVECLHSDASSTMWIATNVKVTSSIAI